MRKATGNRLQVTVMVFLLSLLPTACGLSTVYAIDSTPSADIKTKLEELKKEIASKAAEIKKDINKKLTNKAYIGNLNSKSQNTLTLSFKNGSRIINITQDTEFESQIKAKKSISLKSLEQEDYLAGLGDVDENGVLTAKKIVLLNPIPYTLYPKTYLWGQIVGISDKLVTLKGSDGKNKALSVPTGSNVNLNDFVILTGSFGKNEIFISEFVYVIPQGGILKPKKIATPSAHQSTKSANP